MIKVQVETIVIKGKIWRQATYYLLGVEFGHRWHKEDLITERGVIRTANKTAQIAYHFRNNPQPFIDAFESRDSEKMLALTNLVEKERAEFEVRFVIDKE